MENNNGTEHNNSSEEKHDPWQTLLAYLIFFAIAAVLSLATVLIKSFLVSGS